MGVVMKALVITKEQFDRVMQYTVPDSVISCEGALFIVEPEVSGLKERMLFKRLHRTDGDYFSNKLLTIYTLIDNEKADFFTFVKKIGKRR